MKAYIVETGQFTEDRYVVAVFSTKAKAIAAINASGYDRTADKDEDYWWSSASAVEDDGDHADTMRIKERELDPANVEFEA